MNCLHTGHAGNDVTNGFLIPATVSPNSTVSLSL